MQPREGRHDPAPGTCRPAGPWSPALWSDAAQVPAPLVEALAWAPAGLRPSPGHPSPLSLSSAGCAGLAGAPHSVWGHLGFATRSSCGPSPEPPGLCAPGVPRAPRLWARGPAGRPGPWGSAPDTFPALVSCFLLTCAACCTPGSSRGQAGGLTRPCLEPERCVSSTPGLRGHHPFWLLSRPFFRKACLTPGTGPPSPCFGLFEGVSTGAQRAGWMFLGSPVVAEREESTKDRAHWNRTAWT